jgi:hypothetical protein
MCRAMTTTLAEQHAAPDRTGVARSRPLSDGASEARHTPDNPQGFGGCDWDAE